MNTRVNPRAARTALTWTERVLLVVAIVGGAWCLAVWLEGRFTRSVDVAPLRVTMTLPGDADHPSSAAPPPHAGTLLGRLDAPRVGLSAPILEGSDDGTLRRGAGHIEDTALPGAAGNVGIAGHRDTVFRPLRRVSVGDAIDLTTGEEVYHYRISRTLIVNPDRVDVLDPTSHKTLTLVTCYPFEFLGHAPRRFIVQAELVGQEPRRTATANGLPSRNPSLAAGKVRSKTR
ncbi:MAG TPA: class D sortase [Vicinamibacterales bacterium]|jgi:sortase A